jgi:hypothetical protein
MPRFDIKRKPPALVKTLARPGDYATAVRAVAAAVRRGLALRAGYAGILEGARAAGTGTLPDRTVVAIVDYGIASRWRP